MPRLFQVQEGIMFTEIVLTDTEGLPHDFARHLSGFALKEERTEDSLMILLPDDTEDDRERIRMFVEELKSLDYQEFGDKK